MAKLAPVKAPRLRIPARVSWEVRVLVAWLTVYPKGVWLRSTGELYPKHDWERIVPGSTTKRLNEVHRRTAIIVPDAVGFVKICERWKHRTLTRAIRIGFVEAFPTKSARADFHPAGFMATKRSAVRLRLTELGRAAYTFWCLQNESASSSRR